MQTVIYFILWAGLFYVMMRFGCGAHVMGHGHAHGDRKAEGQQGGTPSLRWIPPPKDIDPVCGREVATDRAKPSVHDGNVYYFCSRECREMFEAAPEQYLQGEAGHRKSEREKSHA